MKILAWDIGIKNLSFCLYDTQLNDIIDWNIIDISQNGKEIFNLQQEMVKELDKLPHLLNVDYVVLENQPTFNIKMKTIASALYTYFVVRGCVDFEERKIKNICYVHPKQKLTQCGYDGPEFESTKKQKYQRDKETAIVYCKYFLRNNPKWLEILENHKKADDASDSYLHALAFFNKFVLEELKSTPVEDIKQMAIENNISVGKKEDMIRLLYPIMRSRK